jgi:hypothetical protein
MSAGFHGQESNQAIRTKQLGGIHHRDKLSQQGD